MILVKYISLLIITCNINSVCAQEKIGKEIFNDSSWTFTHFETDINDIGTTFITYSDSLLEDKSKFGEYVGQDVFSEKVLIERHRVYSNEYCYRSTYDESTGQISTINFGNDKNSCLMTFNESGNISTIENFRLTGDPFIEIYDGLVIKFDENGKIIEKKIYNDGVLIYPL